MFNQTQIESYKRITATADLKERVFVACQNTKDVKAFVSGRTIYRLAPLAACLVLCFTLLLPNFRSESQPFYLMSGETNVDFYSVQLPPLSQESATLVRTISMEPTLYTVHLQTIPNVEILSADGEATLDENGNLTWTVQVPEDDAVFTLTLQAGDTTYDVPLTYHAQDGSFSICCQTN